VKIELINQQKIKRVNLKKISGYLKKSQPFFNAILKTLKRKSSSKVSILLCDNAFIRKLNRKYLKSSGSTDVIAFGLPDDFQPNYLGDVVVSVQKALTLGKKLDCCWQKELMLYIIHGILHLLGYRDKTKKQRLLMEAEQYRILEKIFPKG